MTDNVVELKKEEPPQGPRKWVVSSETLAALRSCTVKQEQNAKALGICEWETQRERDKCLTTMIVGSPEFYAAMGRLEFEHMTKRQFFLDAVKRTEAEQRGIGQQAISVLGLPHQDKQGREIDYNIRLADGLVLRFRSEGDGAPRWDEEF